MTKRLSICRNRLCSLLRALFEGWRSYSTDLKKWNRIFKNENSSRPDDTIESTQESKNENSDDCAMNGTSTTTQIDTDDDVIHGNLIIRQNGTRINHVCPS